jgi:hypothetical protein
VAARDRRPARTPEEEVVNAAILRDLAVAFAAIVYGLSVLGVV